MSPAQVNGDQSASAANGTPSQALQIVEALAVVHNAQSSNESRREASKLLEDTRARDDAPYTGYTLAVDRNRPPVVRHYGLSLLEYAIQHRWTVYTDQQSAALREWVVELAQHVNEDDPAYVRNKAVQLWVDVAKRSWGIDWSNMDELLVQLWEGPLVQKDLVLGILETLSEDVFTNEDTTAGLRGNDLNRACVDIFTPAAVLREHFPTRELGLDLRCGEDGWLTRVGTMLAWCVNNIVQGNQNIRISAVKALAVLRTVLAWAIPKAIATAGCVENILKSLAVEDVQIRMVCAHFPSSSGCATITKRLLGGNRSPAYSL